MYSKRSWIQMKEVLPLKISLQRTVPLCLFPLSIVRFWFVSFFLFFSLFLSNDTLQAVQHSGRVM